MLRFLILIVAFALLALPVFSMNIDGYSVVRLHGGVNDLSFAFAEHPLSVVIGHRDNFNAHSFDVVTFYLSNGKSSEGLDIVGIWDQDKEAVTESVSGGADCLRHDFRLLRSDRGGTPALLVADRPLLTSFADNAPVTFKFYVLKQKTDGLPGGPKYWFDLVATEDSTAAYCAVSYSFDIPDAVTVHQQ